MSEQLDLFDTAATYSRPAWACHQCQPDKYGQWHEDWHTKNHLPLRCRICGTDGFTGGWWAELNHGVYDIPAWSDRSLCSTLAVRLIQSVNYLHGDYQKDQEASYRAGLEWVESLGWTVTAQGFTPPDDWPPSGTYKHLESLEVAA